ncbi:hypothetical protein [Vibrio anguillarum]|uniref:hypothetical protein n=1 Tax=Vibrio anguillarum TaxID=55601 RepID=UPI00188A6ADA|nr:hypothetical protein [Vibrio anguillarum]
MPEPLEVSYAWSLDYVSQKWFLRFALLIGTNTEWGIFDLDKFCQQAVKQLELVGIAANVKFAETKVFIEALAIDVRKGCIQALAPQPL